jgi:hypothetical protein
LKYFYTFNSADNDVTMETSEEQPIQYLLHFQGYGSRCAVVHVHSKKNQRIKFKKKILR